jgi:FtsX-like permease family protein
VIWSSSIWRDYVASELMRRRRRTSITLLVYAVGIGVAAGVIALTDSVENDQRSALAPVSAIDRNLYISRQAPPVSDPGQLASEDARAFVAEREQTVQAAIINLAKLGTPGQHFVEDFFLPETAFTFDQAQVARVKALPKVEAAVGALSVIVSHREGTVPDIIAEYDVQAQTVQFPAPTAADQAIIDRCMIRFIQSLPVPSPLPTKVPGSSGNAVSIPFTRAYYACLPERLRQAQLEQRIIDEVINPPATDIRANEFTAAGVDPANPALGMLTKSSIVQGSYFSPGASDEAILAEAYASTKGIRVGSTFFMHNSRFLVVGLARPDLRGLTADVYLPLSQLQRLSGRQARINVIVARAASNTDLSLVTQEVHSAIPGAAVGTSREVAGQLAGSLSDLATLARRFGVVVLLLALAATFLTTAQLAVSSVAKRAPELGILRTIGWGRRELVGQLMAELMVQSIVGGLLGIGVAAALLVVVRTVIGPLDVTVMPSGIGEQIMRPLSRSAVTLTPTIDWRVIGVALIAGFGGGLCAGLSALRQVIRVTPAESLRRTA